MVTFNVGRGLTTKVKNKKKEDKRKERMGGFLRDWDILKNADQNFDLYLACFSCVLLTFAAFLSALTGVGLISSGLN